MKNRCSNIEREELEILNGFKKFHYYCIVIDINVITDHQTLVAVLKNYIATLSQRLQCIPLRIHQYRIKILYKPRPDLFIAD